MYKQLAELQNVLAEFREDVDGNASLRQPIVNLLAESGLDNDCPFDETTQRCLSVEEADAVPLEEFSAYADRVYRCGTMVYLHRSVHGGHGVLKPP